MKDIAALPIKIQNRVEPIIFQELESENPFDLGYLEKGEWYIATSSPVLPISIILQNGDIVPTNWTSES